MTALARRRLIRLRNHADVIIAAIAGGMLALAMVCLIGRGM